MNTRQRHQGGGMKERTPSDCFRRLPPPPAGPDLIQGFFPWEEIRLPERYSHKRSRKGRTDPPFDPFH